MSRVVLPHALMAVAGFNVGLSGSVLSDTLAFTVLIWAALTVFDVERRLTHVSAVGTGVAHGLIAVLAYTFGGMCIRPSLIDVVVMANCVLAADYLVEFNRLYHHRRV